MGKILQKEQLLNVPVTIIAEIGNNHEGNLDNAFRMIDLAQRNGADIVKFQAGTAAGFARNPDDPKQIRFYKKYELGKQGYDKIIKFCADVNIPVMFSVWSEDFAEYRNLFYFKIAARQCNYDTIKKYDRAGAVVSIPHDYATPELLKIKQACILHCVSQYPTIDPMLDRMDYLKKIYPRNFVGVSDHTYGIEAAIMAIQQGADIIEKHFTIDYEFGPLRDHAISMTPQDLSALKFYATNRENIVEMMETIQ